MSVGLAPRPANEEQRVKAVVKTGLIDAPNPELFQVYCDLNGLSKIEEYWNGVNIDSKGIRDTVLYSQPNDLDINLNDLY